MIWKGRCRTRCDLRDHSTQARMSAGERSTPDLWPVRKDTQSPKQEQSVAPKTGPRSNKNLKLKKMMTTTMMTTFFLVTTDAFVNDRNNISLSLDPV